MGADTPILYEWDGEAMVPLRRFHNVCAERFVIGARYRLIEEERQWGAKERFFFACVRDAWQNLNDEQLQRWPSETHLRKWALIKAGFCDQRQHVCSSKAEATRFAAFVQPIDEYAVVVARENIVTVYVAHSQRGRAMTKKKFNESADAVLHVISEVLGCRPEDLGRAA